MVVGFFCSVDSYPFTPFSSYVSFVFRFSTAQILVSLHVSFPRVSPTTHRGLFCFVISFIRALVHDMYELFRRTYTHTCTFVLFSPISISTLTSVLFQLSIPISF